MPRKRAAKPAPAPPAEPSPPSFVYEHHESSEAATPTPVNPPLLCASLADFSTKLTNALEANDQAFIPEPCHQVFHFHPTATFLVDLSHAPSLAITLPQKVANTADPVSADGANDKKKKKEGGKAQYLLSAAGAMNIAEGDADRSAKQRAVARAIVDAVQDVDGYRYRRWYFSVLKEEKGWRGVFICRDSVQNKDRVANAQTPVVNEDEENDVAEEVGKKQRKAVFPTYNCEGVVTVRLSSKSQVLEVTYKHLMLHRETAWRSRITKLPTENEIEARKERKNQRRKDERKKAMEKRQTEGLARGGIPKTRKRKAGATGNGQENGSNAMSGQMGNSADGNNLNMLAQLLRADIDSMNEQATAEAMSHSGSLAPDQNGIGPPTDIHATGETPSDEEHREPRRRQSGGCLMCRKRKVKCDRTKPRCEACIRSSRECVWPDGIPAMHANISQATLHVHDPVKTGSKAQGCLNCRDGKVKCDQGRPSCLACRLKKHECVYADNADPISKAKNQSETPHQMGVQSFSASHLQALGPQNPSSSHQASDATQETALQPTLSQDSEPMTQQMAQPADSQPSSFSQSEATATRDVKPKKKRRKRSPPIRLALSPSPPYERPPISTFAPRSGASRAAVNVRPVQEEHIVFEPEDT